MGAPPLAYASPCCLRGCIYDITPPHTADHVFYKATGRE
jgi:hypothetical protein